MLGPHRFSLQSTMIDHHGHSVHYGPNTTSVNCYEKTFYFNDNRINKMIDDTNSSIAYVLNHTLITLWVYDYRCEFNHSHGAGTSSVPYEKQVGEQALTPVGWMMYFLLMTTILVHKINFKTYTCFILWLHHKNGVFLYQRDIYIQGVDIDNSMFWRRQYHLFPEWF